jgi:glyoxalase family protein
VSTEEENALLGVHHITLVARNAERTARFYTEMLGLTFVKKTVNFDQPNSYHLYFGDEVGTPGSLVTFFEWPNAAPGRVGIGTTHHMALTVNSFEGLLKWKTWLQRLVRVKNGTQRPA